MICGLNGAGKSTVGAVLAEKLSFRFIDAEDLFFSKEGSAYEYGRPRKKEDAIRILESFISTDRRFVFSSVIGDYGNKFLSALDRIVYIKVPKEERLKRVRSRSYSKYGERMLEGGDLFDAENAFFSMVRDRSEDYVENWLQTVDRPVIHIDGTKPVEESVSFLVSVLQRCEKGEV